MSNLELEHPESQTLSPDAPDEPTGPEPVIRFNHVSRWYGEVIAVNGVSAAIRPGITGLLGPNGAGKSTLIRMAMGLLHPNQGAVEVMGETPWDNPDLLRRIGYVPEGPAPWRDHSGHACVRRAALLSGMTPDEADEKANAALERVGLSDAAQKKVSAYSHGMSQRLKFALALVHEPELLILDEPLLGTDPLSRRDLLDLMRTLADDGHSILLSTHVLTDVEALTDRILLINHGRVMAHGAVHEIRDLLERYPRNVRIATSDPRGLGAKLWAWDSVLSVEAAEAAVIVRTSSPAAFYEKLQDLLVSGDVAFQSVTSPDDTVEAVFRYLVGGAQ